MMVGLTWDFRENCRRTGARGSKKKLYTPTSWESPCARFTGWQGSGLFASRNWLPNDSCNFTEKELVPCLMKLSQFAGAQVFRLRSLTNQILWLACLLSLRADYVCPSCLVVSEA